MFYTILKRILRGGLTSLLRLSSLLAVSSMPVLSLQGQIATQNYLHTSGNQIVDASGTVVGLSGINWFGFETSNNAPHGLWSRNWQEMLDQIQGLGYNVIRLPYSNAMLTPGTMPTGIDYMKNPDLANLTALEVMDRIIGGAKARGIRIILDNHRSTPGGGPESSGLWYSDAYPERRWIEDWKALADRYKGNDAVIGMDLRNEPFNACWGCGDPSKDWRLAAEKAGNAILSINPELLILVEGVAIYNNQSTWWGGNLMGAKEYPVRLQVPNRLVYSPHEYPASIFPQSWFNDPNYPNNLVSVWDMHWGYLAADTPILIGEFGTRLETERDRQWFQAFQSYIKSKRLHWTFWSLNPNSGDTGGLLLDDWTSVHPEKQAILKTIQYPFIGSGSSLPLPTSTLPSPTATIPSPSSTPLPLSTATPAAGFLQVNTRVMDDFESGSAQNWGAFQSNNSVLSSRLVSPGQTGNYALQVDFSIGAGGWAGAGRTFNTPEDWSGYKSISFQFYGTNSGATIRFEILDNRAAGVDADTSERYAYLFSDNFTGWKSFDLAWNTFVRRSDWQPAGAPNDGFNLTAIYGFNFSPVHGNGSFRLDQIQFGVTTTDTSVLILDNWEDGNLAPWSTFEDSNSIITAGIKSPGRSGLYALSLDYGVAAKGWGGTEVRYSGPQDWSGTAAVVFWMSGGNSGNAIRLEVYENRASGSTTDTAERFEYRLIDNWSGWKQLTIPWSNFTRRADWQPQGAPNDGFSRSQVWGFNFSPINGQGSFQLDDIQLLK